MGINDSIKTAMLALLKDRGVKRAVEVTGWDEDSYKTGYCETCEYTAYEVDIYYLDDQGGSGFYTYDGTFAELITDLDRLTDSVPA